MRKDNDMRYCVYKDYGDRVFGLKAEFDDFIETYKFVRQQKDNALVIVQKDGKLIQIIYENCKFNRHIDLPNSVE